MIICMAAATVGLLFFLFLFLSADENIMGAIITCRKETETENIKKTQIELDLIVDYMKRTKDLKDKERVNRARELKKNHPDSRVDVYLGFSGQPMLVEEYERVADSVTVNVGGFVTDDIDPAGYDVIMTCGPEVMMRVLYQKCVDTGAGAKVYVSMENRMACGMGACLVCTCKTKSGNKRACKDGPVMEGWEVFG